MGTGEFPGPGGETINREAHAATERWNMGIHFGSGGKRGGGIRGNRRIHSEKAEHGRAVHIYAIASGTV